MSSELVPTGVKDIQRAVVALLDPYFKSDLSPILEKKYLDQEEIECVASERGIHPENRYDLGLRLSENPDGGGFDERGLFRIRTNSHVLTPPRIGDCWCYGGPWYGQIVRRPKEWPDTDCRSSEDLAENMCHVRNIPSEFPLAHSIITPDGAVRECGLHNVGHALLKSNDDCIAVAIRVHN